MLMRAIRLQGAALSSLSAPRATISADALTLLWPITEFEVSHHLLPFRRHRLEYCKVLLVNRGAARRRDIAVNFDISDSELVWIPKGERAVKQTI